MGNNENLNSFVNKISEKSNNNKMIFNYKYIRSLINLYNAMVAYRNITNIKEILIPSIVIEKNKLYLKFNLSEISDFKSFSDCMKKYCKTCNIRQNIKSITVKI